jgi:predicted nuclease of predicted toxin-antitoxin system
MRILLDMNLPPSWVGFLRQEGFEAIHWSEVGDPRASDSAIMTWAHDNAFVIFSHDLDFSALLAASHDVGPSVVQVRPGRSGSATPRYRGQHRCGAIHEKKLNLGEV